MRVAAIQMPGTTLEAWPQTLALLDDLVARAAGGGAELAVLPECAWPAYVLGSRGAWDAARAAGLPGPGFFPAHVRELAQRHRLVLCAGFVEQTGDALYNSAIVAAPQGFAVRRKTFLWSFDRDWFAPGDRIEPLGPELHRAGVMICADARLPEIPATLAARGARLLLQPTAWVNAGTTQSPWNPQPDFLIRARAAEFGLPVISASKCGREGATDFVGGSMVCDFRGEILGQHEQTDAGFVLAEILPRAPRPPQLTSAERARLVAAPRPPRPDVPACELVWLGPATRGAVPELVLTPDLDAAPDTRALAAAGIDVQCLPASAALPFAPARVAALGGAHLLLFSGTQPPEFMLQARACENRVWAVAAAPDGWRVIDPRGRLVEQRSWAGTPRGYRVRIEPRLAADKLVAPRTDVLAGRAPALYFCADA